MPHWLEGNNEIVNKEQVIGSVYNVPSGLSPNASPQS